MSANHPEPELVKQTSPTTCGQAVIAMLWRMKLDDAIKMLGHDGITSDDELIKNTGTFAEFQEGSPSQDVVAVQKHRDPDGEREHWTLWWKGRTLDPACIGKRLWPVSKHVVVDWLR